jgi:hypothetical protein
MNSRKTGKISQFGHSLVTFDPNGFRQKAADRAKQLNVLPSLKKSATLAKKLKSLQKKYFQTWDQISGQHFLLLNCVTINNFEDNTKRQKVFFTKNVMERGGEGIPPPSHFPCYQRPIGRFADHLSMHNKV